jgi:hypothetical protein
VIPCFFFRFALAFHSPILSCCQSFVNGQAMLDDACDRFVTTFLTVL